MNIANENELRKHLFRLMAGKTDCHWTRVESHSLSLGVPDLAYTVNGNTGWMELKHSKNGEVPRIRASQKKWISENTRCGGHPLIMTSFNSIDGSGFILNRGNVVEALYKSKTLKEWKDLSIVVWGEEINWQHLMFIMERSQWACCCLGYDI
jgi:hypothetical protein